MQAHTLYTQSVSDYLSRELGGTYTYCDNQRYTNGIINVYVTRLEDSESSQYCVGGDYTHTQIHEIVSNWHTNTINVLVHLCPGTALLPSKLSTIAHITEYLRETYDSDYTYIEGTLYENTDNAYCNVVEIHTNRSTRARQINDKLYMILHAA